MLDELIWGLVQGLTEFLPISSSGHLVLVPALLGIEPPDLATSALLHLGTLAAVVAYYRNDLRRLLGFRGDPEARRVIGLLALASLPAGIGVLVDERVARLQESTRAVSIALIGTGLILFVSRFLVDRTGKLENASPLDAFLVGCAQALALIPGISRSGATIVTGIARGLDRVQAARLSFLMAVPAITAAALFEGTKLADAGSISGGTLVATAVAGVSGYAAIAILVRMLGRIGLQPFAAYAVVAGIVGLIVL